MLRIHCAILLFMAMVGQIHGQDSTRHTSFAIYPAIGYSPETQLQLGALSIIVLDKEEVSDSEFDRPTTLSPYVLYSTRKQLMTALDMDIFIQDKFNLNGDFKYSDYPDYFYGLGNEVSPDSSEQYTRQSIFVKGRFMRMFTPELFAGLQFDLGHVNVKEIVPGGFLEQSNPLGIDGGWVNGLGIGGVFDTRSNTLYPTSGSLATASFRFYGKWIGSAYDYTSINLDYRKYMNFLWPGSVLALHANADFTTGNVPFFDLSKIGGSNQLRGISNENLYNERHVMFVQVEGRQKLFWRFGGVLFAGVGQSFDSFSSISGEHVRFAYGIGGRFQAMKDQPLNLRLDLGLTNNGQKAIYLSIKEAF